MYTEKIEKKKAEGRLLLIFLQIKEERNCNMTKKKIQKKEGKHPTITRKAAIITVCCTFKILQSVHRLCVYQCVRVCFTEETQARGRYPAPR